MIKHTVKSRIGDIRIETVKDAGDTWHTRVQFDPATRLGDRFVSYPTRAQALNGHYAELKKAKQVAKQLGRKAKKKEGKP